MVRGAFAQRDVPARRSRPVRGLIALGAALALIAAAFTPPGQAVTDWVRDTVEPGRDDARPALVSLPAPGRLLVTSQQGPWIVEQDGSRRLLGAFDDASWSPGGLFVAATRGRELVAVDPRGRPRWSLARPALVSDARWSPDGFRIAYSSGNDLRVVAGDGTGDAPLAENVADTPPAWRPGPGHRLAFADRAGRVNLVETDSGSVVWRSREGPAPSQLAWSLDGRLLLAVAPTELRLFDAGGRLVSTLDMPPGTFADSAAFRPTSDGFALATHTLKRDRSRLALVRLRQGSHRRARAAVGRGAVRRSGVVTGRPVAAGHVAERQPVGLHPRWRAAARRHREAARGREHRAAVRAGVDRAPPLPRSRRMVLPRPIANAAGRPGP